MTAGKPICPVDDEFHEADVHRKSALEGLVADENAQALTPVEVGELNGLRARWGRYLVWRGRVDTYYDDVAKAAAQPQHPADPENLIASIMRERRAGRMVHVADKGERRDGYANAAPASSGRESGSGLDRIRSAVAANADRLEANRLKPGGFVW